MCLDDWFGIECNWDLEMKYTKDKKFPVSVRLTNWQINQLDRICQAENKTPSQVIRERVKL